MIENAIATEGIFRVVAFIMMTGFLTCSFGVLLWWCVAMIRTMSCDCEKTNHEDRFDRTPMVKVTESRPVSVVRLLTK